jgi:hypothetical protein
VGFSHLRQIEQFQVGACFKVANDIRYRTPAGEFIPHDFPKCRASCPFGIVRARNGSLGWPNHRQQRDTTK